MGSPTCGTYHCNLHAVWDESLIEHEGLSEKKYTAHLLQEINENHWERMSGGSPLAWAEVSHHYAVEAEVPSGALLTHDYVEEESKIVDAQLALGGLRLARVLNRILGAPTNAAPQRQALPKPADTGSPVH
jgi:lysine/ornithine N-monooxygenase